MFWPPEECPKSGPLFIWLAATAVGTFLLLPRDASNSRSRQERTSGASPAIGVRLEMDLLQTGGCALPSLFGPN